MQSAVATVFDNTDTQAEPRTAKRTPVKGGPVLMADCTTPIAGETLLSLLWKRWDERD